MLRSKRACGAQNRRMAFTTGVNTFTTAVCVPEHNRLFHTKKQPFHINKRAFCIFKNFLGRIQLFWCLSSVLTPKQVIVKFLLASPMGSKRFCQTAVSWAKRAFNIGPPKKCFSVALLYSSDKRQLCTETDTGGHISHTEDTKTSYMV